LGFWVFLPRRRRRHIFQSRTMPRRNLIKTNKYKTEISWLPKRKTTTTRNED
jgi:hypothetical protein